MTTLGGDQGDTLGSTATIEHNSLCTFQEGDRLDLIGLHIVSGTGHTINQYQHTIGHLDIVITINGIFRRTFETPHTVAVETSHIALHVVKAVGVIVLIHQLSVVH